MMSPPQQARQQDFDFWCHVAASCLVRVAVCGKLKFQVECCSLAVKEIDSPLVLQATALDCELVPISPLAGNNN